MLLEKKLSKFALKMLYFIHFIIKCKLSLIVYMKGFIRTPRERI